MNRKQFVILLVLVIVVGGAGLLLRNKQSASWEGSNPGLGKKILVDLPINDVAHIVIKQGTNEVNLAKKEEWRVRERNDYPANYSEISDFLIKVHDVKAAQSQKVGSSQLPKLALVPGDGTNSALVIDFKDANDKTLKSLLLGKKHMRKSERPSPYGGMGDEGWPDGRYVKVAGSSDDVALISDAMANIEPNPAQWLNKDFFKVEKMRSVTVSFAAATNSWKLARETENGELKLQEPKPGEQLDSAKTSALSSPLSSPTFNDVAANAKPEQFGLDKPTVVTLDTFDNFSYTVKVGQKTNDIFPLIVSVTADIPKERTPGKDEKADDKTKLDKEFKDKRTKLEEKLTQEKGYEKWIYLVSSWTLDPVLKERGQLMVEKKDEKKEDKKDAKTAGLSDPAKPDEPASDPLTPTPEPK